MTPADTSGWVLEPWSYAVPNEAAPCVLDANGFSVDNAGTDFTSLGDGCYIRSQDHAYRMERRLEHGDLALFFQFDPARTDNFRIVLTPYTNTGTWVRHGGTCWIRLAAESGAENPELSLYCGGADRWKRTVQRSWIDVLWNGLVVVEQSESRVCVELPGGPRHLRFGAADAQRLCLCSGAGPAGQDTGSPRSDRHQRTMDSQHARIAGRALVLPR